MGMKIERKCTRCRREDNLPVESLTKAAELEESNKKQATALDTLKACVEKIPVEERPALFVVMGGTVIAHSHLCADPENKRSCAKRVQELMASVDELDERKPRTKKEKPEKPEKKPKPNA